MSGWRPAAKRPSSSTPADTKPRWRPPEAGGGGRGGGASAEERAAKASTQSEQTRREADEHAKSLIGNARRNADGVVTEARTSADRMLADAKAEAHQIRIDRTNARWTISLDSATASRATSVSCDSCSAASVCSEQELARHPDPEAAAGHRGPAIRHRHQGHTPPGQLTAERGAAGKPAGGEVSASGCRDRFRGRRRGRRRRDRRGRRRTPSWTCQGSAGPRTTPRSSRSSAPTPLPTPAANAPIPGERIHRGFGLRRCRASSPPVSRSRHEVPHRPMRTHRASRSDSDAQPLAAPPTERPACPQRWHGRRSRE